MVKKKKDKLIIVAFILGVISVITPYFHSIVLGTIGIIIAIKQRKKYHSKFITATLILNIIGLCLGIIFSLWFIVLGLLGGIN